MSKVFPTDLFIKQTSEIKDVNSDQSVDSSAPLSAKQNACTLTSNSTNIFGKLAPFCNIGSNDH